MNKKKSSMAIVVNESIPVQVEPCLDHHCEKELGKGHQLKLKRGPEVIQKGYKDYPDHVLEYMDNEVGEIIKDISQGKEIHIP